MACHSRERFAFYADGGVRKTRTIRGARVGGSGERTKTGRPRETGEREGETGRENEREGKKKRDRAGFSSSGVGSRMVYAVSEPLRGERERVGG